MDCPNLQSKNGFCHCSVIDEFNEKPIHCPTSKHSPCHSCKLHWTTPPTKDSLNIVLIEEIKKPKQPEPSLVQKVVNYTEALIDHTLFGQEVPEHIVQERTEICKACPNYNVEQTKCNLCGCSLAGDAAYQNKLRMSNQICPDTPPRWGAYSPS